MTAVATPIPVPSEAGVLAGEVAKSFGQMVRMYEQHFSLSREEAFARATDVPAELVQRALDVPPDQVSWLDLHAIARTDPDRASARWEEIKRAALAELQTGHTAGKAVETVNDCAWQRAQFLALRGRACVCRRTDRRVSLVSQQVRGGARCRPVMSRR